MADLNNITIKLELKKKERTLQSTTCEQIHMAHLQKLCIKPQRKSQTSIKQKLCKSYCNTTQTLQKRKKLISPPPPAGQRIYPHKNENSF